MILHKLQNIPFGWLFITIKPIEDILICLFNTHFQKTLFQVYWD